MSVKGFRFGLGSIGFSVEADDLEKAIDQAREIVGADRVKELRVLSVQR